MDLILADNAPATDKKSVRPATGVTSILSVSVALNISIGVFMPNMIPGKFAIINNDAETI